MYDKNWKWMYKWGDKVMGRDFYFEAIRIVLLNVI